MNKEKILKEIQNNKNLAANKEFIEGIGRLLYEENITKISFYGNDSF